MATAILALEDGTIVEGEAFGACGAARSAAGEVVFNTAMTGYQEALSDPSYAGQILTFTLPLIGNYGVSEEDVESPRPQVAGAVVRELSRVRSNHRADGDLGPWLARAGVLGIQCVDTRALVRRLRVDGAMRGVISCDSSLDAAALVAMARASPRMAGCNLAAAVSPGATSRWDETLGAWGPRAGEPPAAAAGARLTVLALDCGAKRNILRHLADRGCAVVVAPHDLDAAEIDRLRPDGILVSNGPGDPAAVTETVALLRQVAPRYPTFGICLGHQLLALALGGRAYKLKFGHRGANQPVRNLLTGRVEITSQNHGFCIEPESLGDDVEATHVHLNDGTLAGFRHRRLPIFAVQYHPEASPGPHDSAYLFECFIEMMRTRRPVSAESMGRGRAG
jgi:carbamoyl-phosphate synthase small subunit